MESPRYCKKVVHAHLKRVFGQFEKVTYYKTAMKTDFPFYKSLMHLKKYMYCWRFAFIVTF